MKTKIIVFGSFNAKWSHNRQVLRLLRRDFEVDLRLIENRGNPNIFSLFKYFIKNFNHFNSIPKESKIFIGFNSLYDPMILGLINFFFRKKLEISFEFLVSQHETYVYSKPRGSSLLFKAYLFLIDFLNLHFSDKIIFDTQLVQNRILKRYFLKKKKTFVIPIAADNTVFLLSKDFSFFKSKKLNVLWYGNPSKLHNYDFIIKNLEKLDKEKFIVTVINDMNKTSIEELSGLLKNAHIALGCFGKINKCKEVIINKEYEALASHTCLITSEEKEKNLFLLNKSVIFSDKIEKYCNILYNDRELLYKISKNGYEEYLINCKDDELLKNYKTVLQQNINKN